MSTNPVNKKIIYYIQIRLASPLSVSNGDDGVTDRDVLRDWDGIPFISGTSLAGAMRAYLMNTEGKCNIFGSENADSFSPERMSSVFISDLNFINQDNESSPKVVIRDSVALSDDKAAITGAKFDMEAIDTGAEGRFTIELIVRKNDNEDEMKREINVILRGLRSHEIRLGSKKTRGYGEVDILTVWKCEYSKENICEYADAYDWDKIIKHGNAYLYSEDFLPESVFDRLELQLKLTGGISIRQYSAKKGEPDYVQITADGKPVIPGTSFTGAIRHRSKEILYLLGVSNDEEQTLEDEMFGYVRGKKACSSRVVVSESVIENSHPLVMTRTAISRFEGSVKKEALYTEKAYVEGNLVLTVDVRKGKPGENDWMIGLLFLIFKDIQKGYLPVGGLTAVGRGIMEGDADPILNGVPVEADGETETKYMNALEQKVFVKAGEVKDGSDD